MAVRTRRVVALIALAVALLFAGLSFPWANSALVRIKLRLFDPQDVYESLARDDDRWGVVVAGVSRGEQDWLQIAADLRDVLDTHPGEELMHAITEAFDANPEAAVRILVPRFGAYSVCATPPEGETFPPAHARRRLERLRAFAVPNNRSTTACQQALERRLP